MIRNFTWPIALRWHKLVREVQNMNRGYLCVSFVCANLPPRLCCIFFMMSGRLSSFLSCLTNCSVRGIFTTPGGLSQTWTKRVALFSCVSRGSRVLRCLQDGEEARKGVNGHKAALYKSVYCRTNE